MSTFELRSVAHKEEGPGLPRPEGLGSAFLLNNARWFTRVRWIVVAVFAIVGLIAKVYPEPFIKSGVVPPVLWPWFFVGLLTLMNSLFIVHTRRMNDDSSEHVVTVNVWLQIVVDLLFVTVLVHIVGSTHTVIAFAYLFHIVLACIFFPVIQSFGVTLIAACLYILCVTLEFLNILPSVPFLAATPHVEKHGVSAAFAMSAILIWAVVWYFVSTLSKTLRMRERQLSEANEQLIKVDQEKNREVLRTAHDLKAPFSGIESNIQVLQLQYWDEITEPVRGIINRIQLRSQALSARIRDTLTLGNLRGRSARPGALSPPVSLQSVFNAVTDDLEEQAKGRNVSIDTRIPKVEILADEKQLVILFSNLLANAVVYSREGGTVEVSAKNEGELTCVSISDEGIGISDEALPHIFDEYYRAKEGAKANKLSTGLGLAIVKRVALNLGLKISVTTEMDKGTTFTVALQNA